MKVKDIKKKVAAKVAKGKAKVAKKCGKCAVVALALLALAGCLYPTAPSRSQHLAFEHCNFTIIGGGDGGNTNEVARVDIGSQAMAIETSGTENNTNTPTQTTDIKPETNVNTTGGRTAGILESAISAGAALLKGDSTCPAGNCSASCDTGNCSDGSCSTCSNCAVK